MAKKPTRRKNPKKALSDQVREAVDATGLSRYRVARMIGVTDATMSRFMAGKTGLSMAILDRLAKALKLSITRET